MQLRQFLTDDDAVSPVIGVILMVAITVILAAVIGAFVLGFGGGGPSAPSVTWDSANGSDWVAFEHDGGDTIQNPNATLSINGPDSPSAEASASEMTTGTEFNTTSNPSFNSGDEYTLVWEPEDGDSTQELASHTV